MILGAGKKCLPTAAHRYVETDRTLSSTGLQEQDFFRFHSFNYKVVFVSSLCVAHHYSKYLTNSSSDDNTFQPLSSNFSILRVYPAPLNSSSTLISIGTTIAIAGVPLMFSVLLVDAYGNSADTSAALIGLKVQNEANRLLVSNNVFLTKGSSAGAAHVSAVMYSNGKNSISPLHGAYGKHYRKYSS